MGGVPVIDRFVDEYAFLSNFHLCTIKYHGVSYPSSEHAYQASKTLDPDERSAIRFAATPGEAKKLGRDVHLRAAWDELLRLQTMEEVLRQKFQYEPLRSQILDTGEAELIEGNWWHDQFFGDCRCPQHIGQGGLNHLGRLLMKIRDEIRHALDHEFVAGPRGVCIHPVAASGTEHHVPCGKMRILHERGRA